MSRLIFVRHFLIFAAIISFSSSVLADQVKLEDAFSPRQGATELIVKTISEARKSVRVAAYSFTSQPIASALVAAHDRGVDVEVVLDKSQDDSKKVKYLADHGIPTRINYDYSIMHDKFMIVDDNTLELGSFNYTTAAEYKNAENVLVLHNADKVVKDYNQQWDKLWKEAEQ